MSAAITLQSFIPSSSITFVPGLMVLCYTKQKIRNRFAFESSKRQGFEIAM